MSCWNTATVTESWLVKKCAKAITTSSSISYKKRASIEIMLALSLFMVGLPRVELGTNGL
jgi:hypothetical protein